MAVATIPATEYFPSMSTGVFGHFMLTALPEISAAKQATDEKDALEETTQLPPYMPSMSSGIFGQFLWPVVEEEKEEKQENAFVRHNMRILAQFTKDVNGQPACLCIVEGSVTDFRGDAIVNAANQGMISGGAVDGAISALGGSELRAARLAVPEVRRGIRCPTGEARITTAGGRLKCNHVIHAVGPVYSYGDGELDFLLAKAYDHVMQLARDNNIQSLGIALLSAGVFRGGRPMDVIMQIACEHVWRNLYPGAEIHLCGFTREQQDCLLHMAPLVCGKESEGGLPPSRFDFVRDPRRRLTEIDYTEKDFGRRNPPKKDCVYL